MKKRFLKYLLFLPFIILLIIVLIVINTKRVDHGTIEESDDIYNYDLIHRKDYLSYEDQNYTSIAGIDVSEHNHIIDFKAVKLSGIDFVYMRAAWRGYSEGYLHTDSYFNFNYTNAKENDLLVGVYLFSQAINEEEAIEEAKYLLNILHGRQLDLPIVYDFENIDHDEARSDEITKEQCTKNAIAFFKTIKEEYDDVALYANGVLLNDYYDMELLKEYKLWYAQYYDKPDCKYPFFIWQYSDSGEVPGIEKEVDLNIMFIEK